MSNAEPAILAHLENVRAVGPGRWRACCPGHASRSKNSLSIKQAGDTTLIHDFGPCENKAVLDALGLDWSILFDGERPPAHPSRGRPAGDPLGILLTCVCGAEYLRLRGGVLDGVVACAAGHPAKAREASEIARQVNLVRRTAIMLRLRDALWERFGQVGEAVQP